MSAQIIAHIKYGILSKYVILHGDALKCVFSKIVVFQAFCSTISAILTTHAIFKGVGVGDQTADALSAAVTWIMKDGTGMIGRIAFAWWKGYVNNPFATIKNALISFVDLT